MASMLKKITYARPMTLTERLRDETLDLHQAVEEHPTFSRLTAPTLTRDGFALHLAVVLGFYETVERALAAYADAPGLDLGARLVKAARLRADLLALGWDDARIQALPRWRGRDLSRLDTAWGYVYVMEGATLGGRYIADRLAEHLGLDVRTGLSFFQPYEAEASRMWRAFKQATLDAEAQGKIAPDDVVTGARTCFRDLTAWVEGAA